MYRFGFVGKFGQVVLAMPSYAPGDDAGAAPGDAGDGSQPSGEDVTDSDSGDQGESGDDAGEGSDDRAREESLDDLLDEDDEDANDSRPAEERIKALAGKNKKTRRQLAKALAKLERIKGVDIDSVMARAKVAEQIENLASSNPKFRKLLLEHLSQDGTADGGRAAKDRGRGRDADESDDADEFDPSSLPFDPAANPVNKWFADLAQDLHAVRRENAKLRGQLGDITGRESARETQTRESAWKGALAEIDKHITEPGVRTVVRDAIVSAYKMGHKGDPKAVAAHYMKLLKVNPTQAQRAADAMRSKTATKVAQLPNRQAGGGSPAGPKGNERPRLSDVNRRVRAGQAGPR